MFESYGIEEEESLYADYPEYGDPESYDESYEERASRRRRPMRPISPSPARPPAVTRPSRDPVTHTQLQAVLAKLTQQTNQLGTAVKAVDGRVRTLASDVDRARAGLQKEMTDRKKDISSVRKDLQSTREMTALIPILTSFAGNSPIAAIAPLLLLSGDVSGESSGSSTGSSVFGGGATGMIALLAIASAQNPQP